MLRDLPPTRRNVAIGDHVMDKAGIEYVVVGAPGNRFVPVKRADGQLLDGATIANIYKGALTILDRPVAPRATHPQTPEEEFLGGN